ncbi:hypothetical protein Bca4012_080863 [Brassica carinata]|uniref:Uncharacterized protein n=3 Tax=Brassica TaxID=3705 RepID=A0A0D3DHK5_BRAOL|nr:PREDICTED: uncharacterized protein LOC106304897 [Brassica oleracea var. oleracea]XP_013733119.1 uncharacterized protein BNAC07G44640D [Brassica napus]KAF3592676.1 hypothetical protein DY000_02027851 [Brassica cretica]KAG2238078.1 hypothetical protein Bca52824_092651 [Brassica carinata]
MMIKRIEICIELLKIGMEFVVAVAEAVQIAWRQHLNHRTPMPPPPLLPHGISTSYHSPFLFGFLP